MKLFFWNVLIGLKFNNFAYIVNKRALKIAMMMELFSNMGNKNSCAPKIATNNTILKRYLNNFKIDQDINYVRLSDIYYP